MERLWDLKERLDGHGNVVESFVHDSNNVIQKGYQVNYDELGSSNLKLELKGTASTADKNIIAFAKVTYPRSFTLDADTSFMFHIGASFTEMYIEIDGYAINDSPILYDLDNDVRIVPERTSDNKIGFLLPPSADQRRIYPTKQ